MITKIPGSVYIFQQLNTIFLSKIAHEILYPGCQIFQVNRFLLSLEKDLPVHYRISNTTSHNYL